MNPEKAEKISGLGRKEKSIQKIRTTALDLFSYHGYRGTTIRMIAKEAGISLGLMYNYFKGKQELLKDLVGSGLKEFDREFSLKNQSVESIEEWLSIFLETVSGHHKFWKLVQTLRRQSDLFLFFKEDYNSFFQKLADQVEEYLSFGPRLQKQFYLTESFFLLLTGASDRLLDNPDQINREKLIDSIVYLFRPKSGKKRSNEKVKKVEIQAAESIQQTLF